MENLTPFQKQVCHTFNALHGMGKVALMERGKMSHLVIGKCALFAVKTINLDPMASFLIESSSSKIVQIE